jgi:hypothetical protein
MRFQVFRGFWAMARGQARNMARIRSLCWILLLILGVLGLTLGVKHARRYVFWDNFGVVEAGRIYRSGELKPYQLRAAITKHSLRSVLNLNHYDSAEEALVRSLGLKYFKTGWPGNGVVSEADLRWAHELVTDPENQPILIHCARGQNRTGVVVATYRCWSCAWPRDLVRTEMEKHKHCPRRGFELESLVDRLHLRSLLECTGAPMVPAD